MAKDTETSYSQAAALLQNTCGISLPVNLTSRRWHQLTAWSIITPVILLWRYSQQINGKIEIYDLIANGHLSHKSGTDLDFGYDDKAYRKRAVHQARVIKDMLDLNDVIMRVSSKVTVFRLGFYFDRFDSDDNLRAMEKATDKVAKFEELYGHRTKVSSMHLGLRYDYATKEYHGHKMSSGAGKFVFWGQGSKGFHRSRRWRKVFRQMEGNLAPGQDTLVAYNALRDFEALDKRDPTIVPGRHTEPYSPFDTQPSESVWA